MTTRRLTLVVVCLATAMLMLDIAVVNTALPNIARDLHTDLGGMQWVIDAYTLALATVVLSAGALADRLGRRKLFSIGLALFSVASLACTLADSIGVLEGSRAVQGIGAAIMFAVSLALLAHAFPAPRERAGALAAYGATIGAAFAIGPFVGGALTSGLGWRWIFLVNVPIGLLALAITRSHVEESRDPKARSIDWAGQTVLAGGLFLLVLGLLRGNQDGWTSTPIVVELTAAVLLLFAFVSVELQVRNPMLPMRTFKNRSFTAAQVGAFAISGSFFAVFLYVTLYLQNILHLSPVEAGLVYMPATIVGFLVSGASARLGERVSTRTMISAGLALVGVGMMLMALAGVDSSWTIILPGSIVAMVGAGIFNPSVSNVALSSLPEEHSGLAAGVNDTFRQAGIAVGIAALGALIPAQAALGHGDPQSYVSGLQHALMAGTALVAAGAVATAWLLGPRRVRVAGRLAGEAARA